VHGALNSTRPLWIRLSEFRTNVSRRGTFESSYTTAEMTLQLVHGTKLCTSGKNAAPIHM